MSNLRNKISRPAIFILAISVLANWATLAARLRSMLAISRPATGLY